MRLKRRSIICGQLHFHIPKKIIKAFTALNQPRKRPLCELAIVAILHSSGGCRLVRFTHPFHHDKNYSVELKSPFLF